MSGQVLRAGAKGAAPAEPTARADVGADGVSLEARKAAMAEKSNAGGIHGVMDLSSIPPPAQSVAGTRE
jgi:hypothetical protein